MSAGHTLVIEHTFRASPAAVFEAWSHPDVLRRWWGAGTDWTSPVVEIDLQVGGCYRLAMTDPDAGATYTVVGEYVEVRPPRRLVYTWTWETPGSPTGDLTTLVTVEFHDAENGGTRLVLTHSGFVDADQGTSHEHGWQACIANLRTRVLEGVA